MTVSEALVIISENLGVHIVKRGDHLNRYSKERVIEHISYWAYLKGKYRSDLDLEWKNLSEKYDVKFAVMNDLIEIIESIDYQHSDDPKDQPKFRNAETLKILWKAVIDSRQE